MEREESRTRSDVLLDELLASADMNLFLRSLVGISSRQLGEQRPTHCSVTVRRNNKPTTVCSVDAESAVMDEVQYAAGEGPCLEAISSGQLIEVVDLERETRWPRYVRAVQGQAMRSVLAVPIPLQTPGGAALNCYSSVVGPTSAGNRSSILEYAQIASRAVTLAVKFQREADKSSDLTAALESRTAIDLAAGVIMAQAGCNQQEAVDILRRASSNRNKKLRDVALAVLERFNGPDTTTHFDWKV